MIKTKKQMFIVIGVFTLVMLVGTVTYAFFNYTRTGAANNIETGRIFFSTGQSNTILMQDVFPITSTQAATDTDNARTVTITVTGDTTYSEGMEYLVTLADVNATTSGGKQIPINLEVGVSNLGTEETGDYYTAHTNYTTTSKYKEVFNGELKNNNYVLVGYIAPGAQGINGTITIKAYIDADRILISDTWNGGNTPTDNMGTPVSMGEGKVVLTTTEWNSLTGNNAISFKVKVESNEGKWIEKPVICKRATSLHTETCSYTLNGLYCRDDGYYVGGTMDTTTITYGNLGTAGNAPATGDAFDCNVDGTGFNKRFYYVSNYYDTSTKTFDNTTAVLIYSSNTIYDSTTSHVIDSDSGAAYAIKADLEVAYPNETFTGNIDNWHGPVTAIKHLPTTSEWSNVELKTTERAILACINANCTGANDPATATTGGTLPTAFSYSGKAARLLTLKELKQAGCDTASGVSSLNTLGALTACHFLFEGTKYANDSKATYGPWLETPNSYDSHYVWYATSSDRHVYSFNATNTYYGVRPVIDVPMSKLGY